MVIALDHHAKALDIKRPGQSVEGADDDRVCMPTKGFFSCPTAQFTAALG
jgi:hypothetical protein